MLRALCEYYDCLRSQPDSGFVKEGYSKVIVNYNLVLRADGTIKTILPYVRDIVVGKKIKTVGKEEVFPFRNSKPGIAAETIDHREKYIFGLEWDSENNTLRTTANSVKAFERCREVNSAFLSNVDSPLAQAYVSFMKSWDPEKETQNAELLKLGKEYASAKFVITLEGEESRPLNRLAQVCVKWDGQLSLDDNGDVFGQDAISGQYLPLARTHDKITGVRGGQASGVNLVCFNNTAFESYGRTQSYNGSISRKSMKMYTAALNFLVSSPVHRQMIGDMTLLYWANTKSNEKPYLDLLAFSLFSYSPDEVNDETLDSIFRKMREGQTPDMNFAESSTDFYILGVKPNVSRLSVKIYEKSSFGSLMANIAKHCNDLSFTANDRQLSMWEIDRALQSPVTNESSDPALQAKLLISIIKGLPYPQTLLNTVVRRCRTDRDNAKNKFYSVSSTRARIIKACLIRKKYITEVYNMLQENSTDTAYNLGRLFAVLEKVQTDALKSVNASIKDKFFSSACATPYLVFPRLLKLAQAHLSKLGDGARIYSDKLIQSIISNINNAFPKALNMEEQGMFILGYYQQKQSLYTKNSKGDEE